MSYLPNIHSLRFVEREGKKILQQLVLEPINSPFTETMARYKWEDVPFHEAPKE